MFLSVCAFVSETGEIKSRDDVMNCTLIRICHVRPRKQGRKRKVVSGMQQGQSVSPFLCMCITQSAFTFICLHLTLYSTPEASLEERCYKCQY